MTTTVVLNGETLEGKEVAVTNGVPEGAVTKMQSVELKAMRVYELNRIIALAELEKTNLKLAIGIEMKHLGEDHYIFRLDDHNDLKIVVGDRTTQKLDKEQLAEDLGISFDAAGKKDVLIKKTEEGKLTAALYKQYLFDETNEQVQIRRVNA